MTKTKKIFEDKRIFYLGATVITVLAALLRFVRLSYPGKLVFDEIYYVRDGWTLFLTGTEHNWPTNNTDFLNYAFNWDASTEYIVHPPIGKYIIGLGMAIFRGDVNPYAWRISVAVLGTLSVLLVILIAKLLFKSNILSFAAGVFMALDGLAIVSSRYSILDGILTFFILLGLFFFLLALENKEKQKSPYGFMTLGVIAMALSCCVKWSGLYFFVAFYIYYVLRSRNISKRQFRKQAHETISLTLKCVLITPCVYVLSWFSWFTHNDAYYHFTGNPIKDFIDYHLDMLDWHIDLTEKHVYQSGPIQWLFQLRPTVFYSQADSSTGKIEFISAMGTPLLWWSASIAIFVLLVITVCKTVKNTWIRIRWFLNAKKHGKHGKYNISAEQTGRYDFSAGVQGAKGIRNAEGMRLAQNAEYMQNTEGMRLAQNAEYMQNTEGMRLAQNAEEMRCVPATKDIRQDTQNALGNSPYATQKTSFDYTLLLCILGVAAGTVPWMLIPRTATFNFYAVSFLPFMILTLIYGIKKLWHFVKNKTEFISVPTKTIIVCLCIFIVVNGILFYPITCGLPISTNYWRAIIWLNGWT